MNLTPPSLERTPELPEYREATFIREPSALEELLGERPTVFALVLLASLSLGADLVTFVSVLVVLWRLGPA